MPVREIPLASLGLVTVEAVAERYGTVPRAVQKWVAAGLLPAVVIGSGNRAVYLIRAKDLTGFTKPARGRPKGKK